MTSCMVLDRLLATLSAHAKTTNLVLPPLIRWPGIMQAAACISQSQHPTHAETSSLIIVLIFIQVISKRRLELLGATQEQVVDIYTKQIRSILELAAPVWQSSLTQENRIHIEWVQRAALQVILGNEYTSYSSACEKANLTTLEERRVKLCKKFALKAARNTKHQKWFKVNRKPKNTRLQQTFFCPVIARTSRFAKSPISYLTNLLNVMNN